MSAQTEQKLRVLYVDGNLEAQEAIVRMAGPDFLVNLANDSAEALHAIANEGPFEVVAAQHQLEDTDGMSLLLKVATAASKSARLLLGPKGDLGPILDAVQEGVLSRVLLAPAQPEEVLKALRAASARCQKELALHHYATDGRDRILKALGEVLNIANRAALGRGVRMAGMMRELFNMACRPTGAAAGTYGRTKAAAGIDRSPITLGPWVLDASARLSQIASLALPSDLATRMYGSQPLTAKEEALCGRLARLSASVVEGLDGFEGVARILKLTTGTTNDAGATTAVPEEVWAAHALRVAQDIDVLETQGKTRTQSLAAVTTHAARYDKGVLALFASPCLRRRSPLRPRPGSWSWHRASSKKA
jgi:DNA-binding response OmpR family regulator